MKSTATCIECSRDTNLGRGGRLRVSGMWRVWEYTRRIGVMDKVKTTTTCAWAEEVAKATATYVGVGEVAKAPVTCYEYVEIAKITAVYRSRGSGEDNLDTFRGRGSCRRGSNMYRVCRSCGVEADAGAGEVQRRS